ncbi:MAG: methyltransferase [Promethearchaeota archaeon]|nr:MAG: methyltransferase [Candidatus Lokiarchaeota archaeon]
MNSRERILATIEHKEPDRVPIDVGATLSTGISAIAYYNLKKYLGIDEGYIRIHDVIQQLARVENWFIERFNIDALDAGNTFLTKDEDWYDVKFNGIEAQFPKWFQPRHNSDDSFEFVHSDGTVLGRMSKDTLVMDQTYYPLLSGYPENFNYDSFIISSEKNLGSKCPHPPFCCIGEKDFWRNLRKKIINLKNKSQRIIILGLNISVFQGMHSYRRMDRLLIDTLRKPQKVSKFVEILVGFYKKLLKKICKYVGDIVDIITFSDDLGENKGLMINPETYRNLFKPGHQYLCDYIKKHSSMKIFFHSCGSIKALIPDLIDCGIDILNPIQINANDMNPEEIKKLFGDEITLWGGGADTRYVLNRENPGKVKKHVKDLLEIFFPGGGYVWNTVHNILPDVPPQNIIAMFEAIEEFNCEL